MNDSAVQTPTLRMFENGPGMIDLVREETLSGRQYLVAPIVAVKEMVLGGLFLPDQEIANSVPLWEGKPVTIYHPTKNGHFVGAGSQPMFERSTIGMLWNVKHEAKKLKGEIWIDIEKAQETEGGSEVLEILRNSDRTLEVSTGFFSQMVDESGTHDNVPFSGIMHTLVPDHVALLPNQTGKCSVKHGCGTPRLNADDEGADMDDTQDTGIVRRVMDRIGDAITNALAPLAANELSHDDAYRLLADAVRGREGDNAWVSAVFDDYLIFSVQRGGDTQLYRAEYEISEAEDAATIGTAEEVRRIISYEPVSNVDDAEGSTNEQERTMNRDEIISTLTANADVPFDEEQLSAMTDCQLESLAERYAEEAEEGGDSAAGPPAAAAVTANSADDEDDDGDDALQLNAEVITALNELGAEGVREVVANVRSDRARTESHRAELVKEITRLDSRWTPELLANMEVDQLETLHQSIRPIRFVGAAGARPEITSNSDDGPPAPPSVVLPAETNS